MRYSLVIQFVLYILLYLIPEMTYGGFFFHGNIVYVQFTSQSSPMSPQSGLGLGLQGPGLSTVTSNSLQQQPISVHHQASQQGLIASSQKDAGTFFYSFCFILFGCFKYSLAGYLLFLNVKPWDTPYTLDSMS